MTSLFDGMPGLLADVFGSPVTWFPRGGGPVVVRAVFRRTPVMVPAADGGAVMASDAVLRVPQAHASIMAEGDLITLSDGQTWRIESRIPAGGPLTDHFTDFTMEFVRP